MMYLVYILETTYIIYLMNLKIEFSIVIEIR